MAPSLALTDPDAQGLWYREPCQARSRETLDRFLAALEELLADKTFDEVTVADIATRADRTVGSFYGRFADKDAALLALHARYLEHDLPYLEEFLHPSNWRAQPLELVLRDTTAMFVHAYRHPRPSLRAMIIRAATTEDFSTTCRRAGESAGRAWRRLMVSRTDEITHPDPGHAADVCYRHIFAILHRELLFGTLFPESDTTDGELIDQLVGSTMAVLTGTTVLERAS